MFLCAGSLSVGWIIGITLISALVLTWIIVMLVMVPFKLWFRALVSSAHISMLKLIGMKLRKVELSINHAKLYHCKKSRFKNFS